MRRLLSIYILIMSCLCVMAQTDRQHIRKGNRLYRQQKFDKSEIDYRKAVDKNQNNAQAMYNLGCALMQLYNLKKHLNLRQTRSARQWFFII